MHRRGVLGCLPDYFSGAFPLVAGRPGTRETPKPLLEGSHEDIGSDVAGFVDAAFEKVDGRLAQFRVRVGGIGLSRAKGKNGRAVQTEVIAAFGEFADVILLHRDDGKLGAIETPPLDLFEQGAVLLGRVISP